MVAGLSQARGPCPACIDRPVCCSGCIPANNPSVPAKDPRKFCEKFWLTKFCRNFRLQQEQVTELCLQEALIVTVQARPAVVAFPQGSTCLCQEITLQTWRLTLQTCPSSIGVLPRYSCAVLPLAVTTGMLLLYPLKPLKLYGFCAGDHYAKGKSI